MSLADDFAVMDGLIASTRRALGGWGGSPLEFLALSMEEFVRAAECAPVGAGARQMALSVFLLARQQEVIEALAADLRWRCDALEFLGGLSDL